MGQTGVSSPTRSADSLFREPRRSGKVRCSESAYEWPGSAHNQTRYARGLSATSWGTGAGLRGLLEFDGNYLGRSGRSTITTTISHRGANASRGNQHIRGFDDSRSVRGANASRSKRRSSDSRNPESSANHVSAKWWDFRTPSSRCGGMGAHVVLPIFASLCDGRWSRASPSLAGQWQLRGCASLRSSWWITCNPRGAAAMLRVRGGDPGSESLPVPSARLWTFPVRCLCGESRGCSTYWRSNRLQLPWG